MAQVHETLMGKKLIEHTLPEIARQLERIANALENKQTPNQIDSAYRAYLNSDADDHEIVKQLREIWKSN